MIIIKTIFLNIQKVAGFWKKSPQVVSFCYHQILECPYFLENFLLNSSSFCICLLDGFIGFECVFFTCVISKVTSERKECFISFFVYDY